ncbi:hypothetical protein FOZ60_014151 [Perkinsus olseni]|uniref:Uncharacterized protein n=1 Tax=Perkinsus olseni TaxID=32597 RepID=A0A7J6N997_PEROL|nr:hypothetical protein FOZ60_014151 [Perkinsus olseni]
MRNLVIMLTIINILCFVLHACFVDLPRNIYEKPAGICYVYNGAAAGCDCGSDVVFSIHNKQEVISSAVCSEKCTTAEQCPLPPFWSPAIKCVDGSCAIGCVDDQDCRGFLTQPGYCQDLLQYGVIGHACMYKQ